MEESAEYTLQSAVWTETETGEVVTDAFETGKEYSVTLIFKAAAGSDANFTDVNGQYIADAAAWAAEQVIISGYCDGQFGGENAVTGEQLADLLFAQIVEKK